VQRYLGFNRYQGVLWFNQESFEEWLWWACAAAIIHRSSLQPGELANLAVQDLEDFVRRVKASAMDSGYQVEKLRGGLQEL
jgi:hypothetical protein